VANSDITGAVSADPAHAAAADDYGFPGCRPVRIRRDEIVDYEGRIEFWDAETEIAMVSDDTTLYHEYPSQRLAQLAQIIAQYRGAPIDTFGTVDLQQRRLGVRWRSLQADQTVYLNSRRDRPPGGVIIVGETVLPDVIVEVDNTTDARRRKLGLYESWGFPEVWVEVPDLKSPSRSPRRLAGLTIHLLGPAGYVRAAASKAFPGWTATEIHLAMNERERSDETIAALRRVGHALGAHEGTTPDDDPVLREERRESREEGRTQGREEGRTEGREEGRRQGRLEQACVLLCRQARRKFGAETAALVADQLEPANADWLADLADWIMDCATGRELRDRLAARQRHSRP